MLYFLQIKSCNILCESFSILNHRLMSQMSNTGFYPLINMSRKCKAVAALIVHELLDSSSDEEECRCRSRWVKPVLTNRENPECYENLLGKLAPEDQDRYG